MRPRKRMKYDKAYTEALFKQVQILSEENKNLKKEIEELKLDLNQLEANLFYLLPEIEGETFH